MSARGQRRGILVAIEGIDGVGKSTLQRQLAGRLRRDGFSVGLWREPTDPRLGRRAQKAGAASPWTAAMFFTLDRALALPRLLNLLARTQVVLSDRSFYSTLAYQGSAFAPRDRSQLVRIQRAVTRIPDRVLWLRLPPLEALRRVHGRGTTRAPLERRPTLERVARAYAELARAPGWTELDARAATDRLAHAAAQAIHPLLRRRKGTRRGRG